MKCENEAECLICPTGSVANVKAESKKKTEMVTISKDFFLIYLVIQ